MNALVPVLPENAPFTPEQRAWLNGFIAGVLSRGRPQFGGGETPAPAALRPLTICFGSQTGTAERLAKRAAKAAGDRGFAATVVDLAQMSLARLAQEENVLVITSTYGDGEPPDNARAIHAEIGRASPQAERPVLSARFSVLGLGDSNYRLFCQCAKDFDAALEKLGGIRAAARVDCDTDYEQKAEAWLQAALAALQTAQPGAAAAPASPPPSAPAEDGWSKTRPFPAQLAGVRNLNGAGSGRQVVHAEFALEGSGLAYEPGDALGVWPQNCPDLVQEVLSLLRCDGEEAVPLPRGGSAPLRLALSAHYDLGRPTAEFSARYSAPGSDSAPFHVADLLRLRPETCLPAEEFVRLLRPLAPRLYSISSSPLACPGQVHVTVAAVRYAAHGRDRKGVCSTFLADRAAADGKVGVYLHANGAFRLPEDPSVPIIMVGPGTGIAPFRAFLQHRQAQASRGRAWLFFGDQRSSTDFLYREEVLKWAADGVLTRLDTAFSRDQEHKVYVQHRMREQAKELYAWLEEGARFYVCGDAARMAKDVEAALRDALVEAGGRSPEQAEAYLAEMRAAKRYLRDVY